MTSAMRAVHRALPVVLLAFSLVACGSEPSQDESAGGGPVCQPAVPFEAGKSRVSVSVGDEEREYLLHVPDGYDGSLGHALLLVFHGAGPSADQRPKSEFEFDEIWNEPSFDLPSDMVVAAPQATADAWNPDPYAADGDLATAVLDDVEERLCVDRNRIFATGISSGGVLVSSLACRLSARLTAVGTTIGMIDPFEECRDQPAPLPIISVVGDKDGIFPVEEIASAHTSWARNNGCDTAPSDRPVTPAVSLTEYDGCTDGATVALYVVDGMGHQQARTDCTNIPTSVRGEVCFESEFDFRRTQLEFFQVHTQP